MLDAIAEAERFEAAWIEGADAPPLKFPEWTTAPPPPDRRT
jgi:hypothetical protein